MLYLPVLMIMGMMSEDSSTPWLSGITGKDAKKLIESNSPVIRVVAGPGSGKTTCLKSRIQRLVEGDEIDPARIFVGTFTRAITKETKSKLDSRVKVLTMHSLAYELLRKNPVARQEMQLRFLLEYETDVMLYDIKNDISLTGTIRELRDMLKLFQSNRANHEEIFDAQFGGAVERWLRKHRAMLIGDVVHLCVQGLESKDILPGLFDHVVIDEYQDLTALEQELVNNIWSKSGALVVMGDNNQSIYSFRFNHPKGIEDFRTTWPQCEDFTFNDNRRNSSSIVKIANLMMAEAGRGNEPMIPVRENVGELKAVQWETLDDEIKGLASHIRSRANDSFLVLVPRRFIGYRLAIGIGDDAKTTFSEQILEHPVAQESFALASLLADSDDFAAARTYLGYGNTNYHHAPSYNADAYSKISPNAGGHDLIYKIVSGEISVPGTGQSYIKNQAKKAKQLITRSLSPDEIIDYAFDNAYASNESDLEKRHLLVDNLQELRAAAHEILDDQSRPDLSKVINALRYRIATRLPLRKSESEKPRVNIMTLHSAKGLEADHVIISGIVDQFMPGNTKDIQKREEYRRLLYVAVTRARDSLIISWPRRILFKDIRGNRGRIEQIRTYGGDRWVTTGRSSMLPRGLTNVIDGHDLHWGE